jgi:hypothetical protein
MTMRSQEAARTRTAIAIVAALTSSVVMMNGGVALDAEEVQALIQRVVTQTTRSGVSIHATRHLEAGTVSGKHRGWMDVETRVSPSGAFSWTVLNEGGSERTREKVFKAVLEAEADAWRAGATDVAALSLQNYEFIPLGASDGSLKLQLKPRREDSKLVVGTLTVSADGHPLLLEGRLAKSPSFWVRSVTIVKRYARVGGVSLPTDIESLADVKMFGKSSFSMRFNYSAVNGRPVGHYAAKTSGFGPSPQILALHAQFNAGQ